MPDGVTFRQRKFFGVNEEHITDRAIASVRLSTGLFWCKVSIETSGGSQPIVADGFRKDDAKRLQDSIRARQQAM